MVSRMGFGAKTRLRTATMAGVIVIVALGCRTPDPPMCGPTQALDPTRGECIPSCGTPEAPNFPTCFERDGGRIVESGPASDTGATDVLASDVREDSGGAMDASAEGSADADPCGPGRELVAGECDIRVPRAIAPLSTARVTSRRPRLRWVLPPGVTGAHVEVCADRRCASPLAEGMATDTWTPPSELPTGVAFWRLRGVVGAARSARTSPAWWMWIPARSATGGVQTSWGSVPDVNGDGLGDVVACEHALESTCDGGLCSLDRCNVFLSRFGSGVNLSRPHQVILARSPRVLLGASSAVADVNGDGFADVLLSELDVDFGVDQSGAVRLFLGSASGTLTEIFSMRGRTLDSLLGWSAAGVGDVNGDGYGDIAVAAMGDAPMGLTLAGEVRIYWGGVDGVRADRFQAIARSEPRRLFGIGLHAAGDFNADGFSDVLIAQSGTVEMPSVPSMTFAYAGGPSGLVSMPMRMWTDREGSPEFGAGGGAGDFNGDGFADVWVGNRFDGPALSTISVYHGSMTGPSASANVEIRGDATTAYRFHPRGGSGVSDVDRDGYDDLLLVSLRQDGMPGRSRPLHWFRGSAGSLRTSFATLLGVVDGFRDETIEFTAIGDANGDGFIDYALSRQLADRDEAELIAVHGGPSTIDPVVRDRRAPEMGSFWFGIVATQ